MGIAFKFYDNTETIIKKLNEAMINKLSSAFYSNANITHIEGTVQQFVKTAIITSKVWQSLINGGPKGLDKHFGIPKDEVAPKLETLLDIWSQQIKVEPQTINRKTKTFIFSYKFSAIYADWAEVLSSDAGVTINTSRNHPEGQRLHWLSWLLTEGDQLTIDGYHIDFENFPRSRSGGAYMRPTSSWRIPPDFGPFDANSNFITRQLDLVSRDQNFRDQLISIMKEIGSGEETGAQLTEGFSII